MERPASVALIMLLLLSITLTPLSGLGEGGAGGHHGFQPRRYSLLLDVSVPEIHVPEVWRGFREIIGGEVDGSGVAIAIIDTGIDYRHPDFKFPNGSTKIQSIWDQTLNGKPPKGFNYGYECLKEEIESGTCPEMDLVGHGTHVASIAAGSGLAGPYRGVAPGAYLIIVKTGYPICGGSRWLMEEDKIMDGILYAVKKAEEYGLRLVINLSIGSDNGGHDGNTPLERLIEELSKKGVVFVVAAGNSAADRIHAMGDLSTSGESVVRWRLQPMTGEFDLTIAYNPDDELEFELVTPYGMVYGKELENYRVGSISINMSLSSYDIGRDWEIAVTSIDGYLPEEGWGMIIKPVKLSGEAIWHAWISSDTCSASREHFLPGEGYNITGSHTVTVPATSERAIAVGGYVSRNSWRSYKNLEVKTGFKVGELLYFSGRGPSRDGRLKPDLTAPGSIIVAAKPVGNASSDLDVSQYYTVKHGTSMAAPHVTGVVALMLQLFPNASFDQIYDALITSARRVGGKPSNEWGWGKLDARVIYKLKVSVTGLPPNLTAGISIDGREMRVGEGDKLIIPSLNGSIHKLIAEKEIPLNNSTKYMLEGGAEMIVNGSANISFTYRPWYYLDVSSPLGRVVGGGWYREYEEAWFSAPPAILPPIHELLFKPVFRLSYWMREDGVKLYEPRIIMDKPHKVMAIYRRDYLPTILSWILISTLPITTYLILRRRGRHLQEDEEA